MKSLEFSLELKNEVIQKHKHLMKLSIYLYEFEEDTDGVELLLVSGTTIGRFKLCRESS